MFIIFSWSERPGKLPDGTVSRVNYQRQIVQSKEITYGIHINQTKWISGRNNFYISHLHKWGQIDELNWKITKEWH